jgi:NADPH:quinone reductase-like Zn-dependent oxidoreductase
MAAPINPSDLASYKGKYSQQKKFPAIMGFEGSGVVVESGGGLMGWGLVGKKVAIAAQRENQGTYAQYIVVKAGECLPLSDDTSFEQGSMCIVNPLTVIGMLDMVK